MIKIFSNKKFLIFFGLITLFLFVFLLFYKPPAPLPHVIQTTPTQNSPRVNYFDVLNLKFDQVVDTQFLSVSSTPPEDWITTSTGKDTISLKPQKYFQVDTNYVVNISYNQQLIYTLNFKVAHQQSDPRYAQEVVSEIERNYPLAAKTPYETADFSVIYSTPLTLSITIKNDSLSTQDAITEVKSWVTKNGGDSMAHKYVISPTDQN